MSTVTAADNAMGRPLILVVDDTADNLSLMNNLLKQDYKVKIASSGQQALKIAQAEPPPQLILLDIMMPGMDGYEVCSRLKADPKTSDIPVIFLTAKTEVEDEKKGLELGAVDYITKPISPLIVLARVKNHLALKTMADFLRDKNDFLELEVERRTRELMAVQEVAVRNRQLEAESRMKSEFLANMSHELRTPLNAIIGFSEVLRDELMGELTATQKEYVSDIFTSGNHLLSLINDILDLSKIEAGKMTLELEPLHAATLIRDGMQIVRERVMAQRLKLIAENIDDLGEIWLDARKTKQILYNLLSNAVKFTPEGGEINISARRVARKDSPGGNFDEYLELTVRDTGIGVSDADQTKLFQPFMQIDSTLARRYEGTGLGLAMVKRLAELHGGAVGLTSIPNQGSTFTVWLPWRTHADGADAVAPLPLTTSIAYTATPTAPLAVVQARIGERPLALVVEDDDKAAHLLRVQLESSGFRVVCAATGETALKLAMEEHPDIVTLDIMLSGMDGWEFLERFKQHPQFSAVPVVIVSIVADRNRGLKMGAAQVLQKPVSRDELIRALAVGLPIAESRRRSVLVIDDDPKAVQLLNVYLEPAGYRVLAAYGGQEGIVMARTEHPDMILLDLMMPEVNGFAVVDALKRDTATASIPIIVLSAKQMSAEDRSQLSGYVVQMIGKSEFDPGDFMSEVKRVMAWQAA